MFYYSVVLLFSIITVICYIINCVECNDGNIVSVRIKNGVINGKIETSVDGKQLSVFKSVPYAEPPVGELRFKKPLPVKEWSEPLNAFDWPNPCHQSPKLFEIEKSLMNKNMSEDCLYMNIWSPIDSVNSDVLKPVMLWIHGGGLWVGSASMDIYEGQVLASKGDIVLITINYRLNTLGFFYTGTDFAPGNVGLWDQAMALEWVSDNIKYFGGDPDKVTIFGESAGGWSVGLHILSPVSRHLFKNAVMNSGAYLSQFDYDKPEDHIKKWLKGAKLIGCSDEENPNEFTPKVIDCLKVIEPQKLVTILDLPQLNPFSMKLFTCVVVDGEFLPQKPTQMLKTGNFKKNLNLMVSTTEDEGTFMLLYLVDPIKYHMDSPHNFTYSEAYNELKLLATDLSDVVINGEDVAKLYFNGLSDNTDFDSLRLTIGIAMGDYYQTCPTIEFGKQVFRNSNYKNNVYQYYFNTKLQDMSFCAKWMGVCHANDEFPMFGTPFLLPDSYSDREREISAQMIEFLSDFAKTGVPTPQNGTNWPKYYTINDNIITPYYEITNQPKPRTNFGKGLKINECEDLWKQYFMQTE